MGLSKSQAQIWQKARSLGNGGQAVRLNDGTCLYLVARIVYDLDLQNHFPELRQAPRDFFSRSSSTELTLAGSDAKMLFERLVEVSKDADTYFACLSQLHKARLKYEKILSTQPIPTLEQVGPRSLLQFDKLQTDSLVGLLFWRKWFYDIDNRAGQETGYLFEPILARAVGGTPASASKSPVKRKGSSRKGRQVDCILDDKAYEMKIRVTIAASGQGRWAEELDFPEDCRASGFVPVLVCMDGTPNEKLDTLIRAFERCGGEFYIGEKAWQHLDELAGDTMSRFIEKYVRAPIQDLLNRGIDRLPELIARETSDSIELSIGQDTLMILRETVTEYEESEPDALPPDSDDELYDV
jgi:hypothetical protein